MAIKEGVNHSNNKEKCFVGNLDVLLWYAAFSCSDVH